MPCYCRGQELRAASSRKRVVYTASGPRSVIRGPRRGPGLPMLGPKPCRLHVFDPKPRSPDLLAPISTPAPDLAPPAIHKYIHAPRHGSGTRHRHRSGRGRTTGDGHANQGSGHLQPGFREPKILHLWGLNGPDRPPLHLFGRVWSSIGPA
jgi:hypothetical protein